MTIYEIMRQCRNFFPDIENQHSGTFTITDGAIDLDFVSDNQLFLIEKSHFNDGVHEYPTESLRDETFEGIITPLCPPADFLDFIREVQEWDEATKEKRLSPYQSESFAGYSYTKATANGRTATWKDIFSDRINTWRKV